jgi:hypothetical protein
MLSTPVFSIINNVALVYVSFKSFGQIRDAMSNYLRQS